MRGGQAIQIVGGPVGPGETDREGSEWNVRLGPVKLEMLRPIGPYASSVCVSLVASEIHSVSISKEIFKKVDRNSTKKKVDRNSYSTLKQ